MSILNTVLGIPYVLAQSVNAGEIASETEGQLTQLVAYVIGQIPLWITAFIIVILTFVAAKMAKSTVENKMAAEGFEEENKEVAVLASRSANTIVLVIGITVALKIAGIDLTAIIAAGAFGVGFALQDIIMNFIAGVMILSSGHYHIGDVIKVGGTLGKIQEIQTRATIIKAFDGTKIVVPNASLFKNEVTNFTANPFRRIELACGVSYGEDLQRTIDVVLKAASETQGVLAEPKAKMAFYEWGAYSINFKIKAWVESRSNWIKTRNNMLLNIDTALKNADIPIPFPIQTIELNDEEKKIEQLVNEPKQEIPATMEPVPAMAEVPLAGPTVPPNPEHVDAPQWLKKASTDADKPTALAQSEQKAEEQPVVALSEEPKPIAGIKPVEPTPVATPQPAAEQPSEPKAEETPAIEPVQSIEQSPETPSPEAEGAPQQ